jgi:hypothetical protein
MAMLWADGFDSYSSTSDLSRNWTVGSTWAWNSTNGVIGGGCIQCAPGGTNQITTINAWSIPAPNYVYCCFWVKISAAPNAQATFFLETTGNGLAVNSSGILLALGNGSVIATGNTNICDNKWHWIEFSSDNQAGVNSGHFNCYCDTILQCASLGSGANQNSTSALFQQLATNGTIYVDDFFGGDNNSPAPSASSLPIGPRFITTKRPSSDSSVQFVPDSGSSNSARVNEVSADEDSSYVQSNTSGNADTYNYGAIGFTPATVTSVQVVSRVKNPGAGTINHKARCISNGTTSDGSSTVTPTSYSDIRAIYNQDPNTSASWTAANVDAATFGITVV